MTAGKSLRRQGLWRQGATEFLKWERMAMGVAAVAIWILLAVSGSQAQTVASISGGVTDSSGAGVAGATVTVKSVETGSQRVITVDDEGRYDVESLGSGQYEVRVEATGFRPEVRTGITLVVGQHAEVNLTLRVGEVQEAVVVQGEIPPVLRSIAHVESRRGELHIAAGGRNRDIEFRGRQHVLVVGSPAAGESLFAEWGGIHKRFGDQQHTRRG
jgi:hypothetical protein